MTGATCVFVVDDDPSARRGLARLVRTACHDSRDFGSVAELLGALGTVLTGCVVLDAGMPRLSGEELQAELRGRGVHLPIIIVTADDNPESRRIAQKMKAVGFFRKPVDGKALLDAIDWAMQSNSAVGNPKKT